MGRRRGPASSQALTPSTSSSPSATSPDSDPVTSENPSPEADLPPTGWTGWFLDNYSTIQVLLAVNTALLWWLGSTEAVSTSLSYVFKGIRETFTGVAELQSPGLANRQ